MSILSEEKIDDLSREMVKGGKSVNWLAAKIEAAVLESQEKQEPVAWAYTINNSHSVFSAEKPPEDAYDEGSLHPLYAAPVVHPGSVDCIGLALDLEARAKTVESQTTERAMISAANGLRLIAAAEGKK